MVITQEKGCEAEILLQNCTRVAGSPLAGCVSDKWLLKSLCQAIGCCGFTAWYIDDRDDYLVEPIIGCNEVSQVRAQRRKNYSYLTAYSLRKEYDATLYRPDSTGLQRAAYQERTGEGGEMSNRRCCHRSCARAGNGI